MTQTRKRRLNVRSLDFDGCAFNDKYEYADSVSNLIDSNQVLIENVCEDINAQKYDDVIWMVGSNRQSRETDKLNSEVNETESCFSGLTQIGKEVKKHTKLGMIDSYLLADTYGNKPNGFTFQECLAGRDPQTEWHFDHSKLSVLYAQMHKTASENPDAEIDFDFYDDRLDILRGLHQFFRKNPSLMPKNMNLRLHQYNGVDLQNAKPIHGKGEIDFNYPQNIKRMSELVPAPYGETGSHFIDQLTKSKLQKFKNERQCFLKSPSFTNRHGKKLIGGGVAGTVVGIGIAAGLAALNLIPGAGLVGIAVGCLVAGVGAGATVGAAVDACKKNPTVPANSQLLHSDSESEVDLSSTATIAQSLEVVIELNDMGKEVTDSKNTSLQPPTITVTPPTVREEAKLEKDTGWVQASVVVFGM